MDNEFTVPPRIDTLNEGGSTASSIQSGDTLTIVGARLDNTTLAMGGVVSESSVLKPVSIGFSIVSSSTTMIQFQINSLVKSFAGSAEQLEARAEEATGIFGDGDGTITIQVTNGDGQSHRRDFAVSYII